MASKRLERMLQSLARRARPCCRCAGARSNANSSQTVRPFSSTILRSEENSEVERPRWSYTPEQMKAPFHPRIKDPRKAWTVNEDPGRVDRMYIKFLGNGGEKILTDEIKWLAITHKSFDQGRRGFNDRLAFFGKRILLLQGTLALLNSTHGNAAKNPMLDLYDRTPFQHPSLDGLKNLPAVPITEIISKERLGELATSYGIAEVTRWKPKNPANLAGSGHNVVFSASLFAILGALALQKGGDMADRVARERVLKPLGI